MDTTDTLDQNTAPRGADKKEAFHREAESRIEQFGYERPGDVDLVDQKAIYYLAETDILHGQVQIIPRGGDNNLHYHPGGDGFWMVIQGRVAFYGPDGLIGEYGPNEGLLMPRNARYWFESADESIELHLLHVEARTQQKVQNARIGLGPRRENHKPNMRLNYPANHKRMQGG